MNHFAAGLGFGVLVRTEELRVAIKPQRYAMQVLGRKLNAVVLLVEVFHKRSGRRAKLAGRGPTAAVYARLYRAIAHVEVKTVLPG